MKLSSTAILALAISSVTATAYAETQSQAYTPVTVKEKSAQSEATGFVEGQFFVYILNLDRYEIYIRKKNEYDPSLGR